MTNPSVSVVVVSRGRPKLLQLCLLAISQLRYDNFEVIVVSDQEGLDAVKSAGFFDKIKSALCDVANISTARNIALEIAAGQVVAFIDDDSVPEPGWLYHLAPVFNDPAIDAATGYVRGRNGISFQTRAETVDQFGDTEPIEVVGDVPIVVPVTNKCAIKTVGTNCAFRRSVFVELGGFDSAFSYYLDESDMNMRIANSGRNTAVVPLAQVHHSTAASDLRRANRVPHSLETIGCSIAIYLTKHCRREIIYETLQNALTTNRRRLIQHMLKGRCKRRDIERLMGTMKKGIETGLEAGSRGSPKVSKPKCDFAKFVQPNQRDQYNQISGYRFQGTWLRSLALDAVKDGQIVSLFLFSRTALFHRIRFHPDGYWEQTGGLFGRSVRSEPLFKWYTVKSRSAKEGNRLASVRCP